MIWEPRAAPLTAPLGPRDAGAGCSKAPEHNGGTGGYLSFGGFIRSHAVGVAVLSNYGDAWAGDDRVDRMGMRILRTAAKVALG